LRAAPWTVTVALVRDDDSPRRRSVQPFGSTIQVGIVSGRIRHALFDFDGTLSLLRAGWQEVMGAYFCEILIATAPTKPRSKHTNNCREFITRFTGGQKIYQAMELERQVRATGATPLPAARSKAEFQHRLHRRIDHRLIEPGASAASHQPDTWSPVSSSCCAASARRVSSATWQAAPIFPNVIEEAELLRLSGFFTTDEDHVRIHGALREHANFSKRLVIERIVAQNGLSGPELVAFGDGFVEIKETRPAGCDPWKARRRQDVGACLLVSDWLQSDLLPRTLGITA